MLYLGDVSQDRNNNFNLIRAIAASAVLVSHAYPIALGPGAVEPLTDLTGYSLGSLAVYVFFAISGFLITASFERSSSVKRFMSARALRLLPGLGVSLFLVAFVMGPVVTTLPMKAYLNATEVYNFMVRNLTLIWPQYTLPGVFEQNPWPGVEGSIWTLFYEVVCYMGVFLIGVVGVLRHRGLTAVAFLLYSAYWVFGEFSNGVYPGKIETLRDLSLPFAIGVAFYVWRERLPLSFWILAALSGAAFVARNTAASDVLFILCLSYGTFWLAYVPKGMLLGYNRVGDYSYGIYIYAIPMQGLAVWIFGPMTPVENMLFSFPMTLLPSILSWHFIEGPALSVLKRKVVPTEVAHPLVTSK